MTDAFAELVLPVFQHIIELNDSLNWGDTPDLDEVKRDARKWIDDAEWRARSDERLADEFALAKYGLVAWIDEVLTDSPWGKSVGWGSEEHILEWDLYRTNLREEQFYQHAQRAYDAIGPARATTDPLEVYVLCVALGFLGALRHDPAKYERWVEKVFAKISEADPMEKRPFPEDPDDARPAGLAPRRGPALLVRVSVLSAITAVATLLGYIASVHAHHSAGPH